MISGFFELVAAQTLLWPLVSWLYKQPSGRQFLRSAHGGRSEVYTIRASVDLERD